MQLHSPRQSQSGRLNAATPVSLEREFALYHGKNYSPLSRDDSMRFGESFRQRLESPGSPLKGKNEVVGEVAGNSIELKICFSNPREIRNQVKHAYRELVKEASESGVLVVGSSQPQSYRGDVNYFFTTKVFPNAAVLAGTNSIHLHIGAESFEEMQRRYNTLNRAAPFMLAVSQSSVIEGKENGRARLLNRFISSLPVPMTRPWSISSMDEFRNGMEIARVHAERDLRVLPLENIYRIASEYPEFVTINNGNVSLSMLTPDKIFHPARMRPDKRCEERGLVGSVEFRPIDGQVKMQHDLGMIELSLGLAAYNERRDGKVLDPNEIDTLMRIMREIPDAGFLATGGMEVLKTQLLNARVGLHEIGVIPEYLDYVFEVVTKKPRTSVPAIELIDSLSNQFASSAM